MVNKSDNQLSVYFRILSDPTRRRILQELANSKMPLGVTEIAKPFNMSLPAVSKHLKLIEESGMITRHKVGRSYHFKLVKAPIEAGALWLLRYLHSWTDK
jgi:DNA-binding transcriptional ArsR family regulator